MRSLHGSSSATGTIDVLQAAPGSHVVRTELYNNDHTALSPPVYDEVTVVVDPSR